MPPKDPPGRIRIEDDREPTNRDLLGALQRLDVRLARVETHLTGASDYEHGLLAKVSILTQAHESRKVWTGAAITAGIGGLVTGVWAAMKGPN
jgi:hypothetical protein